MSKSSDIFNVSIQDAQNLLNCFEEFHPLKKQNDIEVLKRAGIIMAMTAWETYVEDRVEEAVNGRLSKLKNEFFKNFVKDRFDNEIRRFHNPTAEKTIQIFRDYLGVDVAEKWQWPNYTPHKVREQLNAYMKLRNDIAHRSFVTTSGAANGHPVKKEDLKRAINFLKNLVTATENSLKGKI